MADVILHAFDWKFAEIAEQASGIASVGYGAVLISPPLYSDPDGPAWWQRYQPKDYRVIRSHLGGMKELRRAIKALHKVGVRIYADVVFNHMANEKNCRHDPYNFPGEREQARYRAERKTFEADRLYGELDFGLFTHCHFNPAGDIANWNDRLESQNRWLSGLPDLALNDWVIEQQKACLIALNGLGFDGYRIDAIKHLPDAHIARVFQIPELADKFIFGEALTSNDKEESIFLWPLLEKTTISYYDFPLHETLRRVFGPTGSLRELANPEATGQALHWARGVTFTVTHDIPNNACFRWQILERQNEFLANVYVICRDGGLPLVFSDHNESARSYPDDHDRWHAAWCRPDIAAMIAFHNAVHALPQRPLYDHDLIHIFARGDSGLVAINKSSEPQSANLPTANLRPGRYRCLIHGHEMVVSSADVTLALPPRQAQIWLWHSE